MTIGACLNGIAWGISAVLIAVMLMDFVRVEKGRKSRGD